MNSNDNGETQKSTEAMIDRIKKRAKRFDDNELFTPGSHETNKEIQEELLKERQTDSTAKKK